MGLRSGLHRGLHRVALLVVAAAVLVGVTVVVRPAGANTLAQKRAEAAVVAARLQELERSLQDANARFEEANFRLRQAEQAVAEAERLAAQTRAEMDQRQAELRGFAVKAYIGGSDNATVDSLLSEDATTGAISRSYVTTLSGDRQDLVDALDAARDRAEADAARLEIARGEARVISDQIAEVRSQAKAQRDEQAALNARVQGEVAELVRQEQERIRRAQQEAAAAAAAARRAADASRGSSQVAVNVPPANGTVVNTAIRAGMTKIGSSYVWAASGPDSFDCSGFTQWAFAQAGVSLPHYSGSQYAMTTRISASQLQPGDLVFWGGGGSAHVAIYIGNDQILHAFSRGVAITNLDGWWYPPSAYGRLRV